MDKLLWVLLPIVGAGAWVAVLAWRGRLPPRPVLNAAFSVLLLVYLLVTAGLGIFWVANQHLPVFDWHYVFGYALLVLLVVHLGYNLPKLLVLLRRRPVKAATAVSRVSPPGASSATTLATTSAVRTTLATGRRPLLGAASLLGLGAAAGVGYGIGLRHGRTELRIEAGAGAPAAVALAVVQQFHDFSTHTRGGLLRRAPGADWGDPPPPFKPPGAGPRVALPAPQPGRAPAGGWSLAALSGLLWHTAGVSARSGGIHFRTAPSSGALFATELYLAALDLPGLDAGLWRHDVPGQALRQVAGGAIDGERLGTGALPAGSRALVVATAVFHRSGHKYRDRTYRYVLADLGHALENLRVAAAASGLQATLLPAFDEARIAAALGLDERDEGVLAAVLLQDAGAAPLPALAAAAWQPPGLVDAAGSAGGWGAGGRSAAPAAAAVPAAPSTSVGVTEAIHRATSLRAAWLPPAGVPAPAQAGAASGPGVPQAARGLDPLLAARGLDPLPAARGMDTLQAAPALGPLQPLPAATSALADPLAVIARRRSVRRFAAQPLALADLAAVLAAMARPGPLLSAAVRIDVVTARVAGLPPGAWRYHPAPHALELRARHADGLRQRARAAALDQDVIGDAAAVLVLAIDRAAWMADPLGAARGYRHAFIECGLAGERAYLEAGARGLGVCAVGAFYDADAAVLVGCDPARDWVTHLAALGRPA